MPPNGLTEKMLFKPKGHGHPKKIARDTITRAVDATELLMSTMVPTKLRLVSIVTTMVEMIIGAMGTEAVIEMIIGAMDTEATTEMRLVLVS